MLAGPKKPVLRDAVSFVFTLTDKDSGELIQFLENKQDFAKLTDAEKDCTSKVNNGAGNTHGVIEKHAE